jgi:hypothetical protein
VHGGVRSVRLDLPELLALLNKERVEVCDAGQFSQKKKKNHHKMRNTM